MDPISEILREINLTGTVYFKAQFTAPWGMTIAPGDVANFHIVTSGSAKVRSRQRVFELLAGDLVLFPTGSAHDLVSDEEVAPRPGIEVLKEVQNAALNPALGLVNGAPDAAQAGLICGHFSMDARSTTPFLQSLPELIILRDQDGSHRVLVGLAEQLLSMQQDAETPGRNAVVDKLAEALLIESLRRFFLANGLAVELGTDALFDALLDPYVSQALALMHRRTSESWTVETLGRSVGLSRAAFAKRFTELCGQPPLSYLTTLRLNRARLLLERSHASVGEACDLVGYANESAFARAFKRAFGRAPGSFARRANA